MPMWTKQLAAGEGKMKGETSMVISCLCVVACIVATIQFRQDSKHSCLSDMFVKEIKEIC